MTTEQIKTNGISLVCRDDNRHIAMNADICFKIEERDGVAEIHISDTIVGLVMEALKAQAPQATLKAGDYRLLLTAVASSQIQVQPTNEVPQPTNQ